MTKAAKINFIKENKLNKLVVKLVAGGATVREAIDYVYDMYTMSEEDFADKYLI